MFVIGVNPFLHVDSIPADFPDRDRLFPAARGGERPWIEAGNTVIVGPGGDILAGPVRGTRRRWSSILTWPGCVPPAGSSTQSATTTVPTSSACTSTPHRTRPSLRWRWLRRRLSVPSAQAQVPQKVRYLAAKSSGPGSAYRSRPGRSSYGALTAERRSREWLQVTGGSGVERLLDEVVAWDVDGVDPCHRLRIGTETAPLFEPGIEPRQVEHQASRRLGISRRGSDEAAEERREVWVALAQQRSHLFDQLAATASSRP